MKCIEQNTRKITGTSAENKVPCPISFFLTNRGILTKHWFLKKVSHKITSKLSG